MGRYFLRRVFYSIFTIFVIATVVFFLLRAIPGGPFTREKALPEEIIEALEKKYNMDGTIIEQYFDYMGGLLTGDLGPSLSKIGTNVEDILASGLPYTASVGFIAAIFIILLGIPVGIISALKQNKWPDFFVMIMATLGVTLPSFVLATLYIYIFAGLLGWVPSNGLREPLSYIGPIIALSGYSLAFVARLTRSSMLEVLRADYIQTARANGLSEFKVIAKHAVKNAIIPVITYIGPTIAALMTGSFIVEKIFAIPGIGRLFVDTVSNRDYTTMLAITVFYGTFYVLMVLLVDVLYAVVDPRIRFEKEKV